MKISKHTRILSILLAVIMVLSTAAVFAEVEDTAAGDVSGNVQTITTGEDEIIDQPEVIVKDEGDTADGETPAGETIDGEPAEGEPADGGEGGSGETGTPVITLDQTTAEVREGATFPLTATVTDAEGNPVENPVLTWTSSDETVATVSEDGLVTGVAAGTAVITVTYETVSATCEVTVTPLEPITDVAPKITKWKKKYDNKDFEGKKDNGFNLSWSHSEKTGVDAYQVIRKKGSKGKWAVVETVDRRDSYSVFVLAPAGTYYYAVRPIQYEADGKTISKYGTVSASKKAKISGVVTSTDGINWYCKAKRKAVIYKKGTGSAKVTKVKKGTKMSAIGRYPTKVKKYKYATRVKVTYKVGKKKVTGWIKWNDLKGGVRAGTTKKDYTRSLKEQFVNETWNKKHKDIPLKKSEDGVLVWVCLHTQRAYTFKWSGGKWVLKHTDRVTTGRFSQPTRSSERAGTIFTITKKVPGRGPMMVQEDGRAYYFTTVSYVGTKRGQVGSVSFHTGTWWWDTGRVRAQIKKDFQPGTFGCIRMTNAGARYMLNTTHVMESAILITMED